MRKSFLTVVLTGVMCFGILVGCGSGSGNTTSAASKITAAATTTSPSPTAVSSTEEKSTAATTAAATTASSTTSSTNKSANKGKKIGVFIAQNGNEFTETVAAGAKSHGEELGFEVNIFDGKADQQTQISQIETCITQGYYGLIIEPVSNDGLDTVCQEALDAKIPVVTTIQTCSYQDHLTSFVGADYKAASYDEAKACLDAIGGKGNVCLVTGQAGTSGEMVCTEGIENALKEYPNVKVLEKQAADWQTDKSLQLCETWIQKYGNTINAIICEDDPMGIGAVKACADAGLKDVYITGRNGDQDALQCIKEGTLQITVLSDPSGMGAKSVDVVVDAASGKKVEANYSVKNVVITKENVDQYLK